MQKSKKWNTKSETNLMNILFSIIDLVTFWQKAERKNADTKQEKVNCKSLTIKQISKENTATSDTKRDVTYLWARNTACTTESAVVVQHMKKKKSQKNLKDLLKNKQTLPEV